MKIAGPAINIIFTLVIAFVAGYLGLHRGHPFGSASVAISAGCSLIVYTNLFRPRRERFALAVPCPPSSRSAGLRRGGRVSTVNEKPRILCALSVLNERSEWAVNIAFILYTGESIFLDLLWQNANNFMLRVIICFYNSLHSFFPQ